jgi:RimJ/RimL family protein N-acetyltransferase
MDHLFAVALRSDWFRASLYDIARRSRNHCDKDIRRSQNGGGIKVSSLTRNHAAAFHKLRLHPDVWSPSRAKPMLDTVEVERYIEANRHSRNQRSYAIAGARLGLVGSISVRNSLDGGPRYLSIWIGRPYWNAGFGTAALTHFLAEHQRKQGPAPFRMVIDRDNYASIKLATKCGFNPRARLSRANLVEFHKP